MIILRHIGFLAVMLLVVNASAASDEKHTFWSEHGKGHEELIRRRDNPLWDVFKKEFVEKQESVER